MIALETLLHEPRYLLHRVDLATDHLLFLDTSRQRLAEASFLDGRTALSDDPAIAVPLTHALAVPPVFAGPDRFIAHVSFCGSTLLARLSDVPGRTFSYKEPQALVDLADAWVACRAVGSTDDRIEPTLRLVLAQLRLRWSAEEVTLVKPSNWVNVILPLIVSLAPETRLALIDMADRDFLRAVFRGGRERIAYTLRLVGQLQVASPELAGRLASAQGSGDPLLDAARLCAAALVLQRRLFDRVDPTRSRRLSFSAIVDDPVGALMRTDDLLGLALSDDDRAAAVAVRGGVHSKGTARPFDHVQRSADDEEVEAQHGSRFDAALTWSTEVLPAGLVASPELR